MAIWGGGMTKKRTDLPEQLPLDLESTQERSCAGDDSVIQRSAQVVRMIDPKTAEIRREARDRVLAAGIFSLLPHVKE
jgi:activator of HSP90 ATPase